MSDSYFAGEAVERAEGAVGAFVLADDVPLVDAAPGVHLRPVAGERLLISHVTIDPHSEAAVHVHAEEQMGVVISGTCEFELDGQVRTVGPGDVYHAPPGVPHGARTGDDACVIVDVFSPPRAALLDLIRDAP